MCLCTRTAVVFYDKIRHESLLIGGTPELKITCTPQSVCSDRFVSCTPNILILLTLPHHANTATGSGLSPHKDTQTRGIDTNRKSSKEALHAARRPTPWTIPIIIVEVNRLLILHLSSEALYYYISIDRNGPYKRVHSARSSDRWKSRHTTGSLLPHGNLFTVDRTFVLPLHTCDITRSIDLSTFCITLTAVMIDGMLCRICMNTLHAVLIIVA